MKDDSFENRPRFSLAEAIEKYERIIGWIAHILDNQDGTCSIMTHINCEHCDYCDAENDRHSQGCWTSEAIHHTPHVAKADPYELQKIKTPENYGLPSIAQEPQPK